MAADVSIEVIFSSVEASRGFASPKGATAPDVCEAAAARRPKSRGVILQQVIDITHFQSSFFDENKM